VIYICVAARNNAATVGLLLWKVRQVFDEMQWEYHLLVGDDGSSDATAETLDMYQAALPMTVRLHERPKGYAATLEMLLREAVERTDRPKRDCAVVLPADFRVSPAVIPELLKRFASGADVVVGEDIRRDGPIGPWLVRRFAPWLLRPGLRLPGIRDLTSGVYAIRLHTVKRCLEDRAGTLLDTDDRCADAELVARASTHARQIAAVPLPAYARARTAAPPPVSLAFTLFRAGRRLRIPAPPVPVQRV
jgi:glycosyltransferase involved in cell wall biosynthesis